MKDPFENSAPSYDNHTTKRKMFQPLITPLRRVLVAARCLACTQLITNDGHINIELALKTGLVAAVTAGVSQGFDASAGLPSTWRETGAAGQKLIGITGSVTITAGVSKLAWNADIRQALGSALVSEIAQQAGQGIEKSLMPKDASPIMRTAVHTLATVTSVAIRSQGSTQLLHRCLEVLDEAI
jgi:hypothetical protein